MWVEAGSNWLDAVAKAWPIILSLGGAAAYMIGTRVRASVSDAEQQAVTNAVEKLETIIEQLVEQKTRTQEHIATLTEKLSEACAEIKQCRVKIDQNTGAIERIRGRMGQR